MKNVSLPCTTCSEEYPTIYPLALSDSGFLKLECDRGHKTTILMRQQKFELLFERGASALIDGYPDAAITRFAVALERFYEIYAKIVLLSHGVILTEFSSIWENMIHQSERQYGAFLAIYCLDKTTHPTTDFPALIEKELAPLRNKVTHKGYIPSHQEAYDYGKSIFQFISPLINHLNKHYSKEKEQVIHEHLINVHNQVPKDDVPILKLDHPTILNFNMTCVINHSFDKGYASLVSSNIG